MQGIKDTSTLTFRKILTNGLTYFIPKFQRDYSWENEHWDDLWQDLENLANGNEAAHYMGYLVLQTSDNKKHTVIDGQQRITTISLLIIATIKRIKELEEKGIETGKNKIRREQLQNGYIGYLDAITLIPDNKLKLNRNNNRFYKSYIVTLSDPPIRGLNSSEKLIKASFEWFYKRLEKFSTGEALVKFIEQIVDKLFFTVITVGDELNAYKVFETLNARGVQLSSSDLLKNYLFSTVDRDATGAHQQEFSGLEGHWQSIVDKLGNEKLPSFLRYYWNSKYKTVRKNDLFRALKQQIKNKKEVFELLRDLNKKADIYTAILDPHDELWNGKNDIKNGLNELKIFGAKQPVALLLSAYSNLPEIDFQRIIKICGVIYFRYNVISGLNPNEQENAFNKIAIDITNNKSFNKDDFKSIYPLDEEFKINFSNKEFKNTSRNNKVIKYILIKLENSVAGTGYDFIGDQNTIEHILPENPSDKWKLSDDIIDRCKHRLGNLCLLEKNNNRNLGNTLYVDKKKFFSESSFKTTKWISEHNDEWDEDRIVHRQKKMANQAKSIWHIDF